MLYSSFTGYSQNNAVNWNSLTSLGQNIGQVRLAGLKVAMQVIVNAKRVECLWRCEVLKVSGKHKPRDRLSLNDGSCVRLQPE
jgi:hypothetical protein